MNVSLTNNMQWIYLVQTIMVNSEIPACNFLQMTILQGHFINGIITYQLILQDA